MFEKQTWWNPHNTVDRRRDDLNLNVAEKLIYVGQVLDICGKYEFKLSRELECEIRQQLILRFAGKVSKTQTNEWLKIYIYHSIIKAF